MRRLALFLLVSFVSIGAFAQYNNGNSFMRRVLFGYQQHDDGFYYPVTDILVDELDHVEAAYAYDKKAQNLYVRTAAYNCVVTLTKEYANVVKENKHIPQLKGGAVDMRVMAENKRLEDKFTRLNEERKAHLEDSIAKVRADSIEKARQDSLRKVREAQEVAAYRASHDWKCMHFAGQRLSCSLCQNTLLVEDTVACVALVDSVFYYREEQKGDLGLSFSVIHATPVDSILLKDKRFNLHSKAFKDSLAIIEGMDADMVEVFNNVAYMGYVDSLRTIAPNGYVTQWKWTPLDSTSVDVKLGYVNMNEKAVKAIDSHYQLIDSEGKVLKNIQAKIDTVIEYMQQGEVQTKFPFAITEGMEMKLTKVVVIYADGTKAAGKI